MSKKSLGWRTMLVVPELETELRTMRHCASTMRVRIAACLPHAAANESHLAMHSSTLLPINQGSRRPTPLKRRHLSADGRHPSVIHTALGTPDAHTACSCGAVLQCSLVATWFEEQRGKTEACGSGAQRMTAPLHIRQQAGYVPYCWGRHLLPRAGVADVAGPAVC